MSVLTSKTGWPVTRGDRLQRHLDLQQRASAQRGDGDHAPVHRGRARPHGRAARRRRRTCRSTGCAFPGAPGRDARRSSRPSCQSSTTTAWRGRSTTLAGPAAGPARRRHGDRRRTSLTRPRKLSVPSGATVRWRFQDPIRHDVTLADGPRAFASYVLGRGATYRKRLTVPRRVPHLLLAAPGRDGADDRGAPEAPPPPRTGVRGGGATECST